MHAYLGCKVGERGIVPIRSTNNVIRQYPCTNDGCEKHLSRINNIRSLANKPKLDKHANPNNASVKKKIPIPKEELT
jgi:hypothetical protein